MTACILAGSVLALLLIFLRAKPSRVIYVKRLAIPVLCIVFILCLILFSKTAVTAAAKGINLWFNIVFPSLFPFFAASEILNATGFVKASGILLEPIMRPLFNVPGCGSFALLMGITSGYPIGAKITCDLREKELITKTEAERLLAFTNNSGPLFIVGAVATGMYGMPSIGIFLLACHILACMTVGFLFRFYKREKKKALQINKISRFKRFRLELLSTEGKKNNAGTLFGDAVRNSTALIIAIGGFIILFSVIINLLLETGFIGHTAGLLSTVLSPFGINADIVSAVLSGFFEITTGSSLASSVRGISTGQQLAAASLIIGWAGLSVHSQVLSIVSKTGISIKPYLLGKLLQGIIAAAYTWFGLKLPVLKMSIAHPVMGAVNVQNGRWLETAAASCTYLIMIIGFYLILFAASYIRRTLRISHSQDS